MKSHLRNSVDVYIDLGGFGTQAMTRPNSPSISGFMKNLRPFFRWEGRQVGSIFAAAYSAQGGASVPERVRDSLDEIFAKEDARISWSRMPSHEVILDLMEKALAADTLARHVALVTMNLAFVPLLEALRENNYEVLICGKSIDFRLRRAADRTILVADFVAR